VPKSTLASWFRDLVLPQALRDQLYDRVRSAGTRALVERNKRQTVLAQERARVIQQSAKAEIGSLSQRELQLIGAALYWAEGDKRPPRHGGRRVVFSNADPAAVAVMMVFFRQICKVPEEKFRAQLTVAPGVSIDGAVRFWSALTRIPTDHFTKTYSKLSRSSKRKRPHRLPYGTIQVRIFNTALFYRIMGWIQAMQDGSDHAGVAQR